MLNLFDNPVFSYRSVKLRVLSKYIGSLAGWVRKEFGTFETTIRICRGTGEVGESHLA